MDAHILIVDDVPANRNLLTDLLRREGYQLRTAASGVEALEAVEQHPPDVILLDVMLPGITGFEVCRRLKSDPETRLIPVVLVTALQEREDKISGINAGADDFLIKPVNPHELLARVRSLVRLKRFTDELDSAEAVILSLAMTVEARDRYTAGHCERMAAYAAAFGIELALPDEDVAALHRGGYLHDVGKVGVPDTILAKPGPLNDEEVTVMRRHTIIGDSLCGDLRILRPVRPIIRHHHERLDGSGYPDGLKGDAIPLLAQIMSIVDVYDALTTDRVYRPALPEADACGELRSEAACGWRNPDLVEQFIVLWKTGRLHRLSAQPLPAGPRPFVGVLR